MAAGIITSEDPAVSMQGPAKTIVFSCHATYTRPDGSFEPFLSLRELCPPGQLRAELVLTPVGDTAHQVEVHPAALRQAQLSYQHGEESIWPSIYAHCLTACMDGVRMDQRQTPDVLPRQLRDMVTADLDTFHRTVWTWLRDTRPEREESRKRGLKRGRDESDGSSS